ncbi:polyprenyl synthetase family protein [Acuticoccus sp. I52.16.1]|uniref:polyprenyl synthetase family protein n=1 Tax=Acuticoccus sp. I52.16.1 TaxID=2928472 RepID=UPI001FD57324|nr:polyprenyl synthetase family protein [Acuticoccus sp. I52.16.1]UOM36834.1 polyprenyl synthetase family protein [Acuticoccus sp. I52.16.1]
MAPVPTHSGIDRLVESVADRMAEVNALIKTHAGSDVTMIPEVADHLIASGGKRIRPMLTLATARLFGYRGEGDVKLATAVEYMHTATLLHDDVVDDSAMRRGKPAARMIWGNQASVLVGDFLLGQAFKLMVDVGSLEALDVFSSAAATISEGEVRQLAGAKSLAVGEEHYMAVIDAKTAALFAAATAAGPILADAPSYRPALESYGRNLGLAFQLIDDALDFAGDAQTLGKNVGDDLREGKATLPVLLAYARGAGDERAFWEKCIERGEVADADVLHARDLVQATGALADTQARAQGFADRALGDLATVPDAPMREALSEVVGFAVARLH